MNVAVLDSGVDATHPDLNVASGGTTCTNDGQPPTVDPFYHGTFVGGVIGALDNSFGVVGVAPGARLWSVRVLRKTGTATTAMVICGIQGYRNDSKLSLGRHLRDATGAGLMVNNDRILGQNATMHIGLRD